MKSTALLRFSRGVSAFLFFRMEKKSNTNPALFLERDICLVYYFAV